MKESKFTYWLSGIILKKGWLIVALFAILTIVSVILSQKIEVVVELEDLLGRDNPVSARYLDIIDSFGTANTIVIVIEGEDKDKIVEAAHLIEERIREDAELSELFKAINLRRDSEYPMKWGLLLTEEVDNIKDLQKLLEQRSLLGALTVLNNTLEDVVLRDEDEFSTNQDEWAGVASMARFEMLIKAINNSLSGEVEETDDYWSKASQEILESIFVGERYNWSPAEDMLTFSLLPAFEVEDIDLIYKSVNGVQGILDEVGKMMPELTFGLGGEISWIVARHEGVSSDMMLPTLIALMLIVLLFFFSFSKIRKIMLAVLTLVIGIIISMGGIAITFGQITMITSIFAVILLGLGIDFGIHLISNYDDFRLKGQKPQEAMRNTMSAGGAPIILGGVTTACAFFALGIFSSSPAIFEFGIVAGMGVLLTLLSMVVLLPALIVLFGGSDEIKMSKWRPMINFSFLATIGKKIELHPYIALFSALLITIITIFTLPKNVIDYDPMNNSPRNHPITETQYRIIDRMKVAPFVSFSISDSIEELRERTEKFKREHLVAQVVSASDFFPPEDEQEERLRLIAAGGEAGPGNSLDVAGLDRRRTRTVDDVEKLLEEIQRLEWNVIELGDLAVAGLGEDNMVVQRRDAMIREIIGAEVGRPGREVFQNAINNLSENKELATARLALIDRDFATKMASQQKNMAVDRIPAVADIPEELREQFVSRDNNLFMSMILPTAETQQGSDVILEYHRSLTQIDEGLTGSVPLYVELITEIFTEAARAGIYVAIVIFILLFLIFRNFKHVILAFIMVALGILWLFGLLPLTGTYLTLTAGLVLPLLVGIGTDDAMHIMHRYRHENGNIERTLRYSGKAVLLTTLTTMIGFGSLALVGMMPTITSIGTLLFIGIGACFLSTVIVLPALLSLGKKKVK